MFSASQAGRWRHFLPSILLVALTGTIAAAVDRFVAPLSVVRSASSRGYSNTRVELGGAVYPRTARDSDLFTVRMARPATRVVSQYTSIDELVYSVVPPQYVVAVSESAFQPGMSNVFEQVRRYHPAMARDPETVMALHPDLLVVSNSSRADFCDLIRDARIPIYRTFVAFTSLEQIAEAIHLTGYLTGQDHAAQEETALFWKEIEEARARRPAHARQPRILGFGGSYSFGRETLFNDVVHTLGGINVGAEGGLTGYDPISTEQIVQWNPEWIVAGAEKGQTKHVLERLLSDPGIALTHAARSHQILVFENNIFLPMSPFVRLLVSALAQAIYG